MQLKELVGKYRELAGGFGQPVALVSFGLSPVETERLFGAFDEDYQLSRYFHFSNATGQSYSINGFPQTHVALDREVESVL